MPVHAACTVALLQPRPLLLRTPAPSAEHNKATPNARGGALGGLAQQLQHAHATTDDFPAQEGVTANSALQRIVADLVRNHRPRVGLFRRASQKQLV